MENQADRDFILINRNIDRPLYYTLSKCIEERKANTNNSKCTIFLTTFGGDPHAAYRMGRCVRNHYQDVRVAIPSVCKSAGTIFAICANELAIGDTGELGPLDIQVQKPDELSRNNSGLDIINALSLIQEHTLRVFRDVLRELRFGAGISTRAASQVAVEIAVGSARHLYEQIDPIKLSEMSRAVRISLDYGTRLNEYASNLKQYALERLTSGYPDHSFVIDRKEARLLFKNISSFSEDEASIYREYYANLQDPETPFGPCFAGNSLKGEQP